MPKVDHHINHSKNNNNMTSSQMKGKVKNCCKPISGLNTLEKFKIDLETSNLAHTSGGFN